MAENSTGSARTVDLRTFGELPADALLFIIAVLSLAISPQRFLGTGTDLSGIGPTTLHNALIVTFALPYVWRHGLTGRMPNPVIIAFSILAISTFTLATRHPALSTVQTFKSLAAYLLGAAVFQLSMSSWLRHLLRWTLPALAPISVLLGLVITIGGSDTFYRIDYTTAFRLQGALIPSHLAMLALVGMMVSAFFALGDKRYFAFFLVNFGIVVWTGTRGAMIAALIVAVAWLIADLTYRHRKSGVYEVSQVMISAVLLCLIFASYLPELIDRMGFGNPDDAAFIAEREARAGSGDGEEDLDTVSVMASLNTSGRLSAWRYYLDVALENPAFGRGIGAGTVVAQGVLHPAFARAPHNEYIRLFVDGGVLGVILVFAAYAVVFSWLLKNLPSDLRIAVLGTFAAFAFVALLDNVLSTQQFAIPFWLYLVLLRVEAEPTSVGDNFVPNDGKDSNVTRPARIELEISRDGSSKSKAAG